VVKFTQREVGEGEWEGRQGVVKIISHIEGHECGRKGRERVVEMITKREVGEGRREASYSFIEKFTKCKIE
jgi:hypothetical protein